VHSAPGAAPAERSHEVVGDYEPEYFAQIEHLMRVSAESASVRTARLLISYLTRT
jgi:hypothetical protein